jgi:hypothetical protein
VTLANAVDEVCIGWRVSRGAGVAGDLSAMIRGVHDDVHQYVFDAAGERFTSGVLVRNGVIQSSFLVKIVIPYLGEFCRLLFTLLKSEFWPDRSVLRHASQAFEPDSLCAEDVGEECQRSRCAIGLQISENLAIRPIVVGKQASEMEDGVHGFTLRCDGEPLQAKWKKREKGPAVRRCRPRGKQRPVKLAGSHVKLGIESLLVLISEFWERLSFWFFAAAFAVCEASLSCQR